MGIDKIAKGAGKVLKKTGKFLDKHLLEEVTDPKRINDSLYYKLYNKKLKSSIVNTVGLTVGGATVLNTVRKDNFRQSMGQVEAGNLSHMSSKVSPLVEATQQGNYDTSRVMNNYRNSGAEGDLVFALHNMR